MTERDEMLKLLEISSVELGRTAETDLRISGDSYATQRRTEGGCTLTTERCWLHGEN